MSVQLGNWGESMFEGWCARAGLVANRSTNDHGGWDYIVEAPPRPDDGPIPLGLRPPHLFVVVQVKTTNSNRIPVKLTNWLAMVNSPLPAFFCVVQTARKSRDTPRRVLLVEVDEEMIEAVYRRLEECGRKGERELHKRKMQVPLARALPLVEPRHHALQRALFDRVGNPARYRERKERCVEACKQAERRAVISFHLADTTLDSDAQVEVMVDHVLGLTESIEVQVTSLVETLLGERRELAEPGRGTVRLGPIQPIDQGYIGVRARGVYEQVATEVRSSAQILPGLRSEQHKFRVDSDLLYFLGESRADSAIEMTFRLKSDQASAGLARLCQEVRLLDLLHEPDAILCLQFGTSSLATIDLSDRLTGSLDRDELRQCLAAGQALLSIARRGGQDAYAWNVSYSTLRDYGGWIRRVSRVLSGTIDKITLHFEGEYHGTLPATLGSPINLSIPLDASSRLSIVFPLVGEARSTESGIEIIPVAEPVAFCRTSVVDEFNRRQATIGMMLELVDWFGASGIEWITTNDVHDRLADGRR